MISVTLINMVYHIFSLVIKSLSLSHASEALLGHDGPFQDPSMSFPPLRLSEWPHYWILHFVNDDADDS